MAKISKPMAVPALNLHPPITDAVRLTDDMQQTLALITAYGVNTRKLLRCSETGVLNVSSARVKDIVHIAVVGDNHYPVGPNIPCSELIVLGHPDNTGNVWVRPDKAAAVDNAWPVAAGDVLGLTLDNLAQLNLYIVEDADILIVGYAR